MCYIIVYVLYFFYEVAAVWNKHYEHNRIIYLCT